MDQQLENKNKYYGKRLSLEQEIMDLGKSQLIDDTSDFRDDSKYHFEIKYCQPHKLHRGDEDTSLSTFQIGMNNLQCQPVKDASFNPSFSRILQEEVDQTKSKHKFSNISTNYQAQSKNDEIQEQQIKNITLKINDNIKLGLQEEEKEYERSFKDNNQGAKNLNVNIQSKMQPSSNDTQCNSINNSRFKLYSHILIQDDIFYEKDDKKLGTKVELALKSQYKIQHTFNNSMYKQNLQKAASIIRFLFSSSINRVSRIRQDVKSFITFLKLRHSNRNLEDLSEQEFLSVQDLSHFYSQKRQNHQSYQVLKILVCLLKFAKIIPTFMPSNMIRVIWDLSVLAFTYIFLYVYSLLIFLDENYFDSKIIQRFNFLAFTIFVIDILVSLNTAFYDKDTIITKRIFIARKYFLSSMFITDFISMFILGSKIISSSKFILYNVNISEFTFGLNMLIFLKANGISSKKKRFDYVFTLTENQKHVSKLINQLATVITVAHFAALGWYFVGVQEAKQNEANWLEKIGIRSISVQGQYVYAIYWAITTMTTGFILQEIEKSSKQLNDDLTTIQRKQFKRNLEVIKDFQKNSQFSSGQSFLECDKNESSMYDTVTHNSNNEDDNNDESYTESQIEEENQSIKKSVTNLEKEKIDKTSKSIILKTDKSYRSNADETELQVSQENQIQRFYSNLVYENQDPNKMASKYFNSQAMFKSFEVTDSIDSINQESQKNISNQQKITQEQNKVQFREEIDTYQYNRPEKQQQQKQIAQSEKEKSNQSNSRVFDKQKPSQLQANFQQGDQQKNQIFKSFNNISQDNYIDNNQFQQSIKLENNKKNSSSSKTGSNSKGNSFQKSQMLANQNNLDKRNSVEISFSNIATLLLLQGKNISSQQQNSANYFNQDKSIKNYNSSIEVNDQNEQISSILTQKNNGSSSNNLTKQKSENKLKSDQYNQLSQKYLQNEDLQIIDRLSKILQNSQLPLLLQLTNGKNLQSADNLCVQNTMDYFDKMQCFKKYYTDYNFDRVIRRLKIIQQEQKKNKKAKPSTKEHHQNMGFTPKASIKQQNTSAIKSKLKEFDINQYKPTFLSYGTKMQKRNIYPINYFNLVNN
ncbi:hypothetical protein ABPG74_020103 [Tetrahymena malaccensis]